MARDDVHTEPGTVVGTGDLGEVLQRGVEAGLLSSEHFTADGTFIEAWASHKSFRKKDGSDDPPGPGRNAKVDFKAQKRANETHASATDPDARLRRKRGEAARLVHHGHLLAENRHGLVVGAELTRADGNAEPEAAARLLKQRNSGGSGTVGAGKEYDQRFFVESLRKSGMTPHVARNRTHHRGGRVDHQTTRPPGYEASQRRRKMVEEVFGRLKTAGMIRKTRHRGTRRAGWIFEFAVAACNLVRMRKLKAEALAQGRRRGSTLVLQVIESRSRTEKSRA